MYNVASEKELPSLTFLSNTGVKELPPIYKDFD
jgi:hypothetical protein